MNLFVILLLPVASLAAPTGDSHPNDWPILFPDYCSGSAQSPIDIETSKTVTPSSDPGPITLTGYDVEMTAKIVNTGHTAKMTLEGTQPTISGGRLPAGDTFEFAQLHWHWGSEDSHGSEHTIDAKIYPMEVHLVHWNKKYGTIGEALKHTDGLAVIGFMYEVSVFVNAEYQNIVDSFSKIGNNRGEKEKLGKTVKLNDIVPPMFGSLDAYYYYQGSLTTPTCNEAVLWTVALNTIPISMDQLKQFRDLQNDAGAGIVDNFRPVQPLNGRLVYVRREPVLDVGTRLTPNRRVVAPGPLGHIRRKIHRIINFLG